MLQDLSVSFEELRFKEMIGHGTFGKVHRAEWNNKQVALKRINVPVGEDPNKMIVDSSEIAALKWITSF